MYRFRVVFCIALHVLTQAPMGGGFSISDFSSIIESGMSMIENLGSKSGDQEELIDAPEESTTLPNIMDSVNNLLSSQNIEIPPPIVENIINTNLSSESGDILGDLENMDLSPSELFQMKEHIGSLDPTGITDESLNKIVQLALSTTLTAETAGESGESVEIESTEGENLAAQHDQQENGSHLPVLSSASIFLAIFYVIVAFW